MRLCIYCAACDQIDESYKQAAREAGTYCADQGYELVYGGGHVGLMGIAADAALAAKGRVIGVIPEFLDQKEVAHKGLTELIITQTMQERQAKMAELSDAFLVLPGGLGTLAEFFEIITWKYLDLHNKPIYVWNYNGYWDALIEMIDSAHSKGFMRHNPKDLFQEIRSLEDIVPLH